MAYARAFDKADIVVRMSIMEIDRPVAASNDIRSESADAFWKDEAVERGDCRPETRKLRSQ